MADKTDIELFTQWKRELKSADVDGLGTIHFYAPPSFAEMRPYANGVVSGDVAGGMLDSIIARVKRADGKPRWLKHHRTDLEQMPAKALYALWSAIGGETLQSPGELSESAEKK